MPTTSSSSVADRSEEHTSELQSRRDLPSFPTRRSADLYMNRFLKHWRASGCGETYQAHVVAYADDFVILSRGHASEAMARTRQVMTRLRLLPKQAKTS